MIVNVIHGGNNEDEGELLKFVENLNSDGAHVVRLSSSAGMDCVLRSQLARMTAWADEALGEDDVMVTSDVDAFVVRGDILQPLENVTSLSSPDKVWLFQYEDATKTGSTFGMCFVATRVGTWRRLLSSADTPESLVSLHACTLQLNAANRWSFDQLILTRAILRSGLCKAKENMNVWKRVNLDPKTLLDGEAENDTATAKSVRTTAIPSSGGFSAGLRFLRFLAKDGLGGTLSLMAKAEERDRRREDAEKAARLEESETCFYGYEWKNCNKARPTVEGEKRMARSFDWHVCRLGGCKWWHFYPVDDEQTLMKKYEEITSKRP